MPETRNSNKTEAEVEVDYGPDTPTDPLSTANRQVQEWQSKAADLRNQLTARLAQLKEASRAAARNARNADYHKRHLEATQRALYFPAYIDHLAGRLEQLADQVAEIEKRVEPRKADQ